MRLKEGLVIMKLPRRNFLHLAAGAVALPTFSRIARAQTYPTRPVRIVVPFPAGSAPDIIARLMGQGLSERLGQQFVIENRPGAASNIGTEIVVKAPPDGYTLLLVVATNAVNATLYMNLNFNFIRDIGPVASIAGTSYGMLVNQSFPLKTVPEFIAHAKTNPGKINMASAGTGSGPHIVGELFKMMTGVDLLHIPYRSSYWPDLLSGQVQVAFAPMPSSTGYIQAGTLRALAVTSATRSEALPNIPTVREFVPGYEALGWYGLGAPKDTPAGIISKLNHEINAALADPTMKARLFALGAEPMPMTPADFGKFMSDETEKWGKVVKFAGIKPD
jgi:tripartite-type tricarboxylate transporter receptor subunit TctC